MQTEPYIAVEKHIDQLVERQTGAAMSHSYHLLPGSIKQMNILDLLSPSITMSKTQDMS